MKQTDTGFAVKVEVPGFDKENIKVTYNKPYLMVNAEQTDGEVVRKYSYKTFLPNIDINAISSNLKNGILTLALPKKAEDQPKAIDIKVDEE
jgi:HSP20 family protein